MYVCMYVCANLHGKAFPIVYSSIYLPYSSLEINNFLHGFHYLSKTHLT